MAFNDVPSDHTHAQAIEWANQNGLVKGYPDGNFYPEKAITRAQLCAILFRINESVDSGLLNG